MEARKKYHLTHAQIQMARELGMNPKKLGGMANHKQERWKAPLPQYIEFLYERRFKKKLPDDVRSIEAKTTQKKARKAEVKKEKRKEAENTPSTSLEHEQSVFSPPF